MDPRNDQLQAIGAMTAAIEGGGRRILFDERLGMGRIGTLTGLARRLPGRKLAVLASPVVNHFAAAARTAGSEIEAVSHRKLRQDIDRNLSGIDLVIFGECSPADDRSRLGSIMRVRAAPDCVTIEEGLYPANRNVGPYGLKITRGRPSAGMAPNEARRP